MHILATHHRRELPQIQINYIRSHPYRTLPINRRVSGVIAFLRHYIVRSGYIVIHIVGYRWHDVAYRLLLGIGEIWSNENFSKIIERRKCLKVVFSIWARNIKKRSFFYLAVQIVRPKVLRIADYNDAVAIDAVPFCVQNFADHPATSRFLEEPGNASSIPRNPEDDLLFEPKNILTIKFLIFFLFMKSYIFF